VLKTDLCRALGIEHPVFCAGIGAAAGAELVAAVSNAGGCGVLGTASLPGKFVRAEIERLKGLTDKPFGVNLVLPLLRKGQVEACFDEQVPILVLFWGDPAPYVDEAHRCGIKVLLQVGSVSEAVAGAEAGVDAIIAQGVEAGGHVKGTTAISVLLPTIVDAVAPLPVIASGGIADGRGLVAALSLGAQGISIGTRFLASAEARAADAYKARIVMANAEDTVYTEQCNVGWANAPHRVLRTAAIERRRDPVDAGAGKATSLEQSRLRTRIFEFATRRRDGPDCARCCYSSTCIHSGRDRRRSTGQIFRHVSCARVCSRLVRRANWRDGNGCI